MSTPTGSALYDDPPHLVEIYLPNAPTFDDGGGVKLNWVTLPSQEDVPCSIDMHWAQEVVRQDRRGNTAYSRVGFLTSRLTVALVAGTKFITQAPDAGRTFIMHSFINPGRGYGDTIISIPAFTYVVCHELK